MALGLNPRTWVAEASMLTARTPKPHDYDLTPLDFYLWGTLKDVVYLRKPATLAVLQKEIESVHCRCAAL
jgi:hypothetical protein